MKANYYRVLFGIGILFLIGCSKDKDDHIEPDQAIGDIETNIVVGEWMISSYMDDGVDETANYAAFTFTFNADGVVSASSDPEMLTGAWRLLESGNPDPHVHFDLFFGVADTHDFDELNEDWDLVSYTANRISLEDVNDPETDTLVFTKK